MFVFLSSAALYHDPGSIPWLLIAAAIIIALGIGIGWGIWSARREDDAPQP
jgi:predicted permease